MPNPVHVLFQLGDMPQGRIVGQSKEYTTRAANKILRRLGPFWAEDYWDTYVRDAEPELNTRRYIENHPLKALSVREPKTWP